MPKITFLNPSPITVEIEKGTTILEIAKKNHVPIGYACGGVCACSTCHIYVRKGASSVTPMKEREEDILDKAFDVRSQSRLSCQCKVISDEDIEVEISRESQEAYLAEHS